MNIMKKRSINEQPWESNYHIYDWYDLSCIVGVTFNDGGLATATAVCYLGAIMVWLFYETEINIGCSNVTRRL